MESKKVFGLQFAQLFVVPPHFSRTPSLFGRNQRQGYPLALSVCAKSTDAAEVSDSTL